MNNTSIAIMVFNGRRISGKSFNKNCDKIILLKRGWENESFEEKKD